MTAVDEAVDTSAADAAWWDKAVPCQSKLTDCATPARYRHRLPCCGRVNTLCPEHARLRRAELGKWVAQGHHVLTCRYCEGTFFVEAVELRPL